MKRAVLAILALFVSAIAAPAFGQMPIYRNLSVNPESIDTVHINFYFGDANLNPQRIATNDYVLLTIKGPGGDSVYAAKIDSSSARILEDLNTGRYFYEFVDQASNIDGPGREGVYTYELLAWDTSAVLPTPFSGKFALYNKNYFRMVDSITAAITADFSNLINQDQGKSMSTMDTIASWTKAASGNTWMYAAKDSTRTAGLVVEGQNAVVVVCKGATNDSALIYSQMTTSKIDTKRMSNFTFWLFVDSLPRRWPEGGQFAGSTDPYAGNACLKAQADGDSPLDWVRIIFSTSSAFTNAMYVQFDDYELETGWNKLIVSRDDFSVRGSGAWTDSMQYVGFELATDSCLFCNDLGANGISNWTTADTTIASDSVRIVIDDLRYDKRATPKFMFNLSDGHASQHRFFLPILREFSYGAKLNVCPGVFEGTVDTFPSGAYLNREQLREFDRYGSDIGSHAWKPATASSDSVALVGISRQHVRKELNEAYRWLMTNGFQRGAAFLEWPYGQKDSTSIRVAMETYRFGTAGRQSEFHDHLDIAPDGPPATNYRFFAYPVQNLDAAWGDGVYDSVRAGILRTIKRGNIIMPVFHACSTHYHDSVQVAGDGVTQEWSGFIDFPLWGNVDGWTPNDNDYVFANDDGSTDIDEMFAVPAHTGTSPDGTPMDSTMIQWRMRIGHGTAEDKAFILAVDTGGGVVAVDTLYADSNGSRPTFPLSRQSVTTYKWVGDDRLTTEWKTYTRWLRNCSYTDTLEVGVRIPTAMAGTDSVFLSWIRVDYGDNVNVGNTQMDSSMFRAICVFLRDSVAGQIDVVTPSEYFRTLGAGVKGSGGRISQMIRAAEQTRDTVLQLRSTLAALNDSLADLTSASIAAAVAEDTIPVSVVKIDGNRQSLLDLKDLVDNAYDPAGDSLLKNGPTLLAIADTVWSYLCSTAIPEGSFGDSLREALDRLFLALPNVAHTTVNGLPTVDPASGSSQILIETDGYVAADAAQVGGSVAAADSLRSMLTGTLRTLSVRNTADFKADVTGVAALQYLFGACDSCYQRLYPEDGSANKDSVIVINPSLGADSLVAKVWFKHSNVAAVYDTSFLFLAPWW